jgi:oligopeptide/dipeptide ABC transporter ATP-binding protein
MSMKREFLLASQIVLEVRNLRTYFYTKSSVAKSVDGVSFDLREGEVLGLVGESGSGKSVTALSILGLIPQPPGRIVSGEVLLSGEDMLKKSKAEMSKIRGREISMILQDPMTSLNPVLAIGDQITEALRLEDSMASRSAWQRGLDLLRNVRIPAPEVRMTQYPHQMSGGMRQRIAGAISISRMPKVLIADEPTTSLDATIQLQYLNLLREIQRETGLAIIFVTHDFGIVARMCDRVAVMYAGKIVEIADMKDLFASPSHPYTMGLLKSVPDLEVEVDYLSAIDGQPPRPDNLPAGCSFEPRCPFAVDRCKKEYPPVFVIGPEHKACCWRLDDTK